MEDLELAWTPSAWGSWRTVKAELCSGDSVQSLALEEGKALSLVHPQTNRGQRGRGELPITWLPCDSVSGRRGQQQLMQAGSGPSSTSSP